MIIFQPLITVLIATYNYEQFISYAIESIINQDYLIDRIELIIIDDGSSDNTKAIVNKYIDKINLIYVYQENKGKASATRLGIELANSKYLFVLDADDYYLSDCVTKVVNCFENDDSIVQVSHLANRLEKGEFIPQQLTNKATGKAIDGVSALKRYIFDGWNVGLGSTYSAKTSVLKQIVIPDNVDMYIDFYLFIMVANKGKIVQLPDYLSVFRRHDSSYSEGSRKFEDKRQRQLRYLKSAKSIYETGIKEYSEYSLRCFFKLFYLQHRCASASFIGESKFSLLFQLSIFTFCLMPFYRKNIRLLIMFIKRYAANFFK